MITLYSMPSSGNSYKVRLLLAQLSIPFRHIGTEYDHGKELTSSPEFRKKNPAGKVPMIEFEDGRTLSESNAILLYFARGTDLLPDDPYQQALVHQWMFFEQNAHEGTIAVRSAILTYPHKASQGTPEVMASLLSGGNRALDIMETQLAKTPFLTGDTYTVADIALYAYTHSAGKGGFDVVNRASIAEWLSRVADQPGHVPLEWLPEGSR